MAGTSTQGGADSLPRRLSLSALAVACTLLLAEGALRWGGATARAHGAHGAPERAATSHVRHDATLGWAHAPSVFVRDAFGPGKHLTTNARGFRARGEITHDAPPGRRRVLYVGDSFTMGHGVGDADTFPARIEQSEPRIQSANLALSGYGLDQAWLSLRSDAARIERHAIVLAFIAHDFQRMKLDFYLAPKPRLTLRAGALTSENAPIPQPSRAWGALRALLGELALSQAFTRALPALPFPREQVSFPPLARAVFADLAAQSARDDVPVLLVYLPTRDEAERGASPVRDWTRREAAKHALPHFDATPIFERANAAHRFYLADGHFSEAGNAAVAEALLPALRALLQLPDAEASRP